MSASPTSERLSALSPLRLALMAEERRSSLAVSEAEPIAVVGMACRFPGASDIGAFWSLLRNGIDAITEVPADRWSLDTFFHPDPDRPGTMYTRHGGFIADVDLFDARFFGISPREAAQVDPQQRLALEVSWEALEDAGRPPQGRDATTTGLFLGISSQDYAQRFLRKAPAEAITPHSGTGAASSVAAGRVSFALGLQGPTLAIDTACSSSLVAVHLACQSLRHGECDTALAGGVNLLLTPEPTIAFCRARMLSPDGRCRTFDAGANGYVRGEGCGMVVLRRLGDAVAAGDRVRAIIRGSAINHDGSSAGLTVPNGPAQEAVIRRALERGAVLPTQVAYVEAHGTGTPLGDPIELGALASVFAIRAADLPSLAIGSVKTNVGHLEAAAGAASLIKAVLALEHREIPPHLHFRVPNPHVPWADLPFRVPAEPMQWPPCGNRRLGGISSFGFSGTNAHVVVEGAPHLEQPSPGAVARPLQILCLSAKSEAALDALAERYTAYLGDASESASGDADSLSSTVADLCHTALVGRAHFPHRIACVGGSAADLRAALTQVRAQRVPDRRPDRTPTIAFLFSGQGAQYADMGRELFDTEPVFRRAVEACDAVLRDDLDVPLLSVIYPDGGDRSRVDQTACTQPALFAIEYGLATLWQSWGVEPALVMGHSVGEYVAATIAGVFPFEEALRLVAARGRLMQSLPAGGAMAAVAAPADDIRDVLSARDGEVVVAAINSPADVTLAGPADALAEVCDALRARGITATRLPVSHAFHSPLMDPILDAFEREAARVSAAAPARGFVTNLTGRRMRAAPDARHWRRHLREPVQCAAGFATLAEEGADILIDMGPSPVLAALGRLALPQHDAIWLSSLKKGRSDWRALLGSLATLYMTGLEIDWTRFDHGRGHRRVDAPHYPFQRTRHWFELPGDAPGEGQRGGLRPSDSDVIVVEHVLRADAPLIESHRIGGFVLAPGALLTSLALAAAESRWASAVAVDVRFIEPLRFVDDGRKTVQIVLTTEGPSSAAFEIVTTLGDGDARTRTRHATGRLTAAVTAPASPDIVAGASPAVEQPAEELYGALARRGFEYGPALRRLTRVAATDRGAAGRIVLEDLITLDVTSARAIAMDCAMQLVGAALDAEPTLQRAYLPAGIASVRWLGRPGREMRCLLTVQSASAASIVADCDLRDDEGRLLASLVGLTFLPVAHGGRALDAELYEPVWREVPRAAVIGPRPITGSWAIVPDATGLADRVVAALASREARVDVIDPATAPDALAQQIEAIGPTLEGIVHLSALDAPPPNERTSDQTAAQRPAWAALQTIVRTVGRLALHPRLIVVTRGARDVGATGERLAIEQAPVWGLVRCLALEHPDLRPLLIDLDPARPALEADRLVAELHADDREPCRALRGDRCYVPRLMADGVGTPPDPPEAHEVVVTAPGTIGSLAVVPAARRAPHRGEVEIAVQASGLNFRDVLTVLDLYPGESAAIGLECAGRVVGVGPDVHHLAVGDDVVALAPRAFASHVLAHAALVCRRPAAISPEDAATLPVAFLTASRALRDLGRITAGDRLLIHAASGGVGLAAVQIAQQAGAEVFATAGSADKRAALTRAGVTHVYDSRSLAFADQIGADTGGGGVDVVLNSLTGDAIGASLSVLARHGRFIEIGKLDIWNATQMASVRPDVEYHVFDLAVEARDAPDAIGQRLAALVDEAGDGRLRPLPRSTFSLSDASRAFRLMAQAKHVGKVVLVQSAASAPASPIEVRDATYLITGGLGAVGLATARWLIGRGARTAVLMSRHARAVPADMLESSGARVVIAEGDVTDPGDVSRVLAMISSDLPPLKGIVHAAGWLEDGVFVEQPWDQVARVLAPKIDGAWNLHQATRAIDLDFFVLCSSAASVMGSPGQSAYAAGNAYLDALAAHRRRLGLPALSINWGPWAGEGMAARGAGRAGTASSLPKLAPPEALTCLQQALAAGRPQALALAAGSLDALQSLAPGGLAPLLDEIAAPVTPVTRSDLSQRLAAAPGRPGRDMLMAFLREQSAKVLGLSIADTIDSSRPLQEYGLDSLMAVELRNAIGSGLGAALPTTLLFDYPTLDALVDRLAGPIEQDDQRPADTRGRQSTASDAIAIIGMACRFPGGADSPDAYWRLLRAGRDAIVEVPADRWDIEAYYDPGLASPSSMNTRWGGFLERVGHFDRQFFGISAQEAAGMDPQQRLLLETAWETFERAGVPPSTLAGTAAGVFIGICSCDYSSLLSEAPSRGGTGLALSIAANRLSYQFDLRGPSLAVDTACSSSLVAVDLACQSLRSGTSDVALAGGVNVILLPETTVAFSQAGMMAPDGRCKTFDESANGYVRSEGCGLVLLKRLVDAEADGNDIVAIIRGSAVNQDGRSSGLTAPNGLAQQAVIRASLAQAGIEPREVGYVEAHGTGTPLGDTIEVAALSSVLGSRRGTDERVVLGSVKTNLGHLEGAAGIAGLMKVALALRHGQIPPHLHLHRANPELALEDRGIDVPIQAVLWARGSRRRIAGVSSFGFGGTNAHVTLEEAPERPPSSPSHAHELFTLSARSDAALVQLARRHLEDLAQSDDRSIGDLCYTSTAGRSHFSRRVAIVTTSREQLLRDLEAVVEGTTSPTVARGSTGRERPKVAFLFPDAMPADLAARELFETDTRFADAIGRSAGAFAVQHALADLWKGWGIAPDVAVGHVPTSGHEKPADGLDVRQLVDAITAAGCGMIVVMGSSEGRAVRAVQEALPSTCHVVPSLDRKTSAWFSVFTAMAALYVRGVEVDWTSGHRSRHRRTVPLTTYPFERQRYWLEQPQAARIPVGEGRDA